MGYFIWRNSQCYLWKIKIFYLWAVTAWAICFLIKRWQWNVNIFLNKGCRFLVKVLFTSIERKKRNRPFISSLWKGKLGGVFKQWWGQVLWERGTAESGGSYSLIIEQYEETRAVLSSPKQLKITIIIMLVEKIALSGFTEYAIYRNRVSTHSAVFCHFLSTYNQEHVFWEAVKKKSWAQLNKYGWHFFQTFFIEKKINATYA